MTTLLRPNFFIFLTLFLSPSYLLRFSFIGIPFNVLEVLIALTFLSWLFWRKGQLKNEDIFSFSIIFPLFILFFGLTTSFIAGSGTLAGLSIIKSWFLFPLLFSFVVSQEKGSAKYVLSGIFFSAFLVSVAGGVYFSLGELTYDGRLAVFYPSPNYLAMHLAFGLFAGYYLYKKYPMPKTFFWVSISLILLSLYITYSYAAWVAVILTLSVAFLHFIISSPPERFSLNKINWKLLLIFLLFSYLIISSQINSQKMQDLLTLHERSSFSSRIIIWKSSFKILENDWLWGIGSGNFQKKYLEYQRFFPPYLEWAVPHPHNIFLAFWLQSGIFGLIAFILILKNYLIGLIRKKALHHALFYTLFCFFIYTILHGMVDTLYWKNDLALIFWSAFALAIKSSDDDI